MTRFALFDFDFFSVQKANIIDSRQRSFFSNQYSHYAKPLTSCLAMRGGPRLTNEPPVKLDPEPVPDLCSRFVLLVAESTTGRRCKQSREQRLIE